MKIYHNTHILPEHRDAVVVIGNFDGVHLGHMQLINAAKAYAESHNCPMGVLTFEPHPRLFFSKKSDDTPFLLTPGQLRTDILDGLGFDFVVLQSFNNAFNELKAHHFIDRILQSDLGVAAVVVGADFGFGHHREGDVGMLEWKGTFDTIKIDQVTSQDHGTVYSSSHIRTLLTEGKARLANEMMGAAFTVMGTVFRNEQTGKELGFPTANIRPMPNQIHPKLGVYAGRVMLEDGRVFDAAINWGLRPSVKNRGLIYEAHLFDFDEILYDQTIKIALLTYLRPEEKFDGIDALRNQIALDCVAVQNILAQMPVDNPINAPISSKTHDGVQITHTQRTMIEASVFRRMVRHLQDNPEVQNIDLMLLADFCRNCLSKWYEAAAKDNDIEMDKDTARSMIYGMDYDDWKTQHQTEASPEKMAKLAAKQAAKKV